MSDLPVTQSVLNKSRKDKFRLILTLPNVLKKIDSRRVRDDQLINLDSLQFSVYNVNIPQIEVPAISLHYSGQNYNVTSFDRPAYPPASVNFVIDNEYKNYWVLWKWLQMFNDPIHGTFGGPEIFKDIGGYPKQVPEILYDYVTTITLEGLDEYNKPKIQFDFRYAFITQLGDFLYDFTDSEEIGCKFSFVYNQLDVHLV